MDNFDIELLDNFGALLDRKEQLAELTKENNKQIESCRQQLADMMVDSETPKISRSGYTYSLADKVCYSKKSGAEDELFELLRENGLGDIIKSTVNAQTLQGCMSNLAAENADEDGEPQLPEEFGDVINVFEFLDVRRRKDSKKIKEK